jgi:hypothetical protein
MREAQARAAGEAAAMKVECKNNANKDMAAALPQSPVVGFS